MAIEPEDLAAIMDGVKVVVEEIIARRMEEVYGTIEQLRGQVQHSVGVLDGNDQAIIERLMQTEGSPVIEYMGLAGAAWERFVKGEAREMGLRVVKEKKAAREGSE